MNFIFIKSYLNVTNISLGVATIVQGMIAQGTSCPIRLLSKGQLSKQNLVQGDFSSKVWVDKYKAAHIIFFIFYK